ncbi:hypothetical protein KP509_30G055200 [Ceratopteris richardii]|uniref:Uncharacterized protein n=1 Tax=Ceratopteris richardii TaxID=49495 RepID=A0A8T2R3L1_CERRI|nr:hypothetical protein KP509_30G055200 [Ceratopteris richardii]
MGKDDCATNHSLRRPIFGDPSQIKGIFDLPLQSWVINRRVISGPEESARPSWPMGAYKNNGFVLIGGTILEIL